MPNGVLIIAFQGSFGSASSFRHMEGVLSDAGRIVVLNCGGVTQLNSPGFGFLVHRQKRLREAGGEFVISQPGRYSWMRDLGGTGLFDLFESDEDAIRYLVSERGAVLGPVRRLTVKPPGPPAG